MHKKTKKKIKAVIWYIGGILITLATVYPFLWMIATSFKGESEIYANAMGLIPNAPTGQNYRMVFDTIPIWTYMKNSLILAFAGVATNILFGSLAGYSFARLQFRGKKIFFGAFLATMMIPTVVTMIPTFSILKFFPLVGGNDLLGQGGQGFINTYWAVILPGAAGAFAVFFMRQFFGTLPSELAEAARIDGCSEFGIFARIYLPLITPAALTLGIMTFQSGWNSYMWPMIVLNAEKMKTVQVGLAVFRFVYQTNYGALMAGTVLATIPTVLIFVMAQRYYVQGIAFSGGK